MSAQYETGDYQEDYWAWQMGPQWAPGGTQPDCILSLPLSIPSSQSPRRSSGSGSAPRDCTRAVSRERGFGMGCKELLLLATTLNCQCSAVLGGTKHSSQATLPCSLLPPQQHCHPEGKSGGAEGAGEGQ